ncbi:MAG: cyclopropane-fatty-acyl-phospholipid synthase family protein [Rhodospirillaceae bacterium]|nr:cyclopropane-fatty-acyl-phospholipid synthase family protein [Rhodospirillaceae bacterium]
MKQDDPTSITSRIGNRFVQRLLDMVGGRTVGRLTLYFPDGGQYSLASTDKRPDLHAVIHCRRWRAIRRFMTEGETAFLEAYVDGDWSSPELAAVIEWAALNSRGLSAGGLSMISLRGQISKLRHRIVHLLNANTRAGSKRNIAAHYDLGNAFYQQWLDPTMTYSSALFAAPGQSLPEGQIEKYRRIAAALDLRPEHHVLEIGFGWGGFAEFAVKEYGCRLTGVTLSKEQLAFAGKRLQAQGLADKVDLRFQDYRDVAGTFDRVASIEMFEAVGESNWPRYFDTVRERLARGGAAALQIITIAEERFEHYRTNSDFIQRHIFPGGMLPSVERLKAQFAQAKLTFGGAVMFGDSYAATLHQWRDRFLAAWSSIEPLGFDERFRRMWEMYLAYCEGGFRAQAINVGQFKLVRE